MCVNDLGRHLFVWRLVAYSVLRNYGNPCWYNINWTTSNKFQWYLDRNLKNPYKKMVLNRLLNDDHFSRMQPNWCHYSAYLLKCCLVINIFEHIGCVDCESSDRHSSNVLPKVQGILVPIDNTHSLLLSLEYCIIIDVIHQHVKTSASESMRRRADSENYIYINVITNMIGKLYVVLMDVMGFYRWNKCLIISQLAVVLHYFHSWWIYHMESELILCQ